MIYVTEWYYEREKEIKKYLWPFLILFGLFLLALSSILRTNFAYYDDLGRVAQGYRGWSNFSRYLSSFLSVFLHGDPYLTDISPWPQILALGIMSIAGLLLLKMFTNKEKFSFLNLLSVIPLALNPYFLECLSYKYDAPYMAFSVLVSIIPLLFAKKKDWLYALSIFLCTLMMCATYQASSGIFLFLVLFYALNSWLAKGNFKENFLFVIKSFFFYMLSLLVFKVIFMQDSNTYVTNAIFSFKDLVPGFIHNFKEYFHLFLTDFKKEWLLLIAFIIVSFVLGLLFSTKQNKVKTFFLTLLVLFGSVLLMLGVYPLFTVPLFSPRAMYGIGVLLTVIMLFIASFKKNIFGKIFVISLTYLFFAFTFTYGNALYEQKKYTEYRMNLVISDLNELEVAKTNNLKNVAISGNIGYSPVIQNMPDDYQMLKRLVPLTFGGENVWYIANFFYYKDLPNMQEVLIDENFPSDLPLIKETMFHNIYADDEYIEIVLK